jgi:SAM-dependent methyltransferase
VSDRRLPGADLRALLRPAVPTGSSPQVLADQLVPGLLAGRPAPAVVDLGCGRGDSVDVFRAADPAVHWLGLDLEGSVEFAQRTRADADLRAFDGRRLPCADGSVDVVFCKQVLEHVEDPDPLLADVARVLQPGGAFAGSTSHLEPFHSRSVANYTPYGLKLLLERAGLELELVLPGIDGPTLIARRLARGSRRFDRWWTRRSPLNAAVDGLGRLARLDAEDRNTLKLLFCGHYAFVARRA